MQDLVKNAEIFSPFSIRLPVKENQLLQQAVERINHNDELLALWNVINVNAIERLGFSDHGPVHVQIVANIALRVARILVKHKVEMSIVKGERKHPNVQTRAPIL